MKLTLTDKQRRFVDAPQAEVLFGGAAGGGKTYAQLADTLYFAARFPGSRQLILRRSFPELERTLVRGALSLYPKEHYSYSSSAHSGAFSNGSLVDFGYCDSENDVYRYQSAEYDVIRFDELTHFTEFMYLYLISRVRGANRYPKQVKSTTNPGNTGHDWVKRRFIDPAAANAPFETATGSRLFIPARVTDNPFLMARDPGYVRRLENLPERERRALLAGDWELCEGRYFTEFDRSLHVVRPFAVPEGWTRYFALDYGLDMLAAYWIAVDGGGFAYVYRELYESGLIISAAAEKIRSAETGDVIARRFAPPDLWNRRQDSGKSAERIFRECGVPLSKASNDRVQGWLALREALRPVSGESGAKTARLRIFDCCPNLIRSLASAQRSRKNPNDMADEPHELTHAPDALRYYVAGRSIPADRYGCKDEQIEDFIRFGG